MGRQVFQKRKVATKWQFIKLPWLLELNLTEKLGSSVKQCLSVIAQEDRGAGLVHIIQSLVEYCL